jgi:predicted ArsR family transcriptional regulator
LRRVARQLGKTLGAAARRTSNGNALAVLDSCGYEPERSNGDIRLRNCPFEALADEARPLVCGMNLALLEGVLQGVGARGVAAVLDPAPGSCCVVVRASHPKR